MPMDLDAKVIGQALQDAQLGTMVENLGVAIATAQEKLDGVAIDATVRLANETTTMLDADGNPVTRSLLELGFAPTFYQFTEATLDVSFIASMHVTESLSVGVGLDVSGQISNASDGAEAFADVNEKRAALSEDVKKRQQALDNEEKEILRDLREQRDKLPAEKERMDKLIDTITEKISDKEKDDK